MKIFINLLLALTLCLSLTSCFSKVSDNDTAKEEITENIINEDPKTDETEADEKNESEIIVNPKEEMPETKPDDSKKPSEKPEQDQKPNDVHEEDKNTSLEENIPSENENSATLGKTLLTDFRKKAASGMSGEEIANELLKNPAVKFAGGVMPVEEGLLTGFDNAEITGFKKGYMFAPMIGSIPFVGYVFELENESDTPAFTALLKENANMRWNICVTAEETVIDSYGNKVFFIMCPESLEE